MIEPAEDVVGVNEDNRFTLSAAQIEVLVSSIASKIKAAPQPRDGKTQREIAHRMNKKRQRMPEDAEHLMDNVEQIMPRRPMS